jgi:arylsulfatase A-like enzyme
VRSCSTAALRVLLLVLAVCTGCRAQAPEGTPNVLLVVVDTLRADHLGVYGYERPTSPEIDALARESTLYTRSFASAPWTLPSHASLFTGLDPFEHGAHSFLPEKPGRNAHPLDDRHPTLAGALGDEGFTTAAFVANAGYMGRWTGLDRGFETYDVKREPALDVNQRIFAWLDRARARPFFLFVNYMDCHRPYNTLPSPRLRPPAEQDEGLLDELVEVVLGQQREPPRELVERVIAQYDSGVAHADEALGNLLDGLGARGLLDETVVVVTSDHGEYFGEHGLTEHSKDVYQPVLWVPLVVRGVGAARARRVEQPVSSVHVPHLIARELGPLAERLRGRFPRAPGDRPLLAENYYTRTKDLSNPRWGPRFRRVRRALYAWPWKHITSPSGGDELYDLEADPAEQRDLIAAHPATAGRLGRELEARLGSGAAGERSLPAEPTEQELEELRALGYVE